MTATEYLSRVAYLSTETPFFMIKQTLNTFRERLYEQKRCKMCLTSVRVSFRAE